MMSFATFNYYIFLAVTCGVYFLASQKFRVGILLVASYAFYFSFDSRYLFFILTTTVTSYLIARALEKKSLINYRRLLLGLSLTIEFSMLFSTKYWNNFSHFTNWIKPIDIIIPIGISFYTFQTVGYIFDVYRGAIKAETNFFRYGVFLSFFPHLLAGPIEPSQKFLPQLKNLKNYSSTFLYLGLSLIVIGLFKKFVIAERFAPFVNLVFSQPEKQSSLNLFLGAFMARYQIYCDFSGYTDIALGSAQLFGISLSPNFNRPFSARSISEYWQRWHMSLTQWIRTYIFYPLVSTYFNKIGVYGLIFVTFLAIGLWHGGQSNFMIYAAINGLLVVLDASTKKMRESIFTGLGLSNENLTRKLLGICFTFFILIVPLVVLFRSPDFVSAQRYYQSFITNFNLNSDSLLESNFLRNSFIIGLLGIVLIELNEKLSLQNKLMAQSKIKFIFSLMVILGFTLYFGYFENSNEFIYFKF